MIYGLKNGETLIVAAADTLVELEGFYADAVLDRAMFASESIPTMVEMLTDDRFVKFKKPPYVFEFDSPIQLETFRAKFEIELVKPNRLSSLHREMLDALEADQYAPTAEGEKRRTIEEIHDLTDNDRWDRRTEEQKEEQKAKDEAYKKMYDEAKKAGKISDDSFSAPKDDEVQITDIRTTIGADGKLKVDNVLGVKGLYADTEKDAAAGKRAANGEAPEVVEIESTPVTVDDEDLSINPSGNIAIYFRVEVENAKWGDIEPHLLAANFPVPQIAVHRDNAAGCWFAMVRKSLSEQGVEILVAAGFKAEAVAVNDKGENLLPKVEGVEVVDIGEREQEPPRPWNDRAYELAAMTPEELAENKKGYKSSEFIFCGNHTNDNGCIFYVAPRSWFEKHGTLYPDSLDIAHILPDHVDERAPGVYQTRSVDWNGLTAELSLRRKFTESMWLQLHLNNI